LRSVSLFAPRYPSNHIQVTAQRLLLPAAEPSAQDHISLPHYWSTEALGLLEVGTLVYS
jgi:hypothetical protein